MHNQTFETVSGSRRARVLLLPFRTGTESVTFTSPACPVRGCVAPRLSSPERSPRQDAPMTESLSRRAGAAVALMLACAASLHAQVPAGTPQAAQAGARPVFVNGMAQVVPAFADSSQWIRQNLWVETDFDSDRDGRNDRVHVDVTRPRQTEAGGLKVPVVYGSSPYYAGIARTFAFWNVRQELGEPSPPRGPMAGPPYDS